MLDVDPRYHEALKPLAAFCEQHGYRWRWHICRPGQWRATVQIIDPREAERRDKVRAWYGSTAHDEISALGNAVRYAIDAAQGKLDVQARLEASAGMPPTLKLTRS